MTLISSPLMTTILAVSIALLGGLLMTRVFKPLKLPSVTAYLIAGVLIGPYCLGKFGFSGIGFTTHEEVEALKLVSDVALGFIAFSIGNEFRVSELKVIGKKAFTIGILQAVVATFFVDAALITLYRLRPDIITLPQAITLGAIATATAPAATLMVVRQYKAKGPLTDLLLPIVALDDAVGLVIFAVSFGIANGLGKGSVDPISVGVLPFVEIVISLVLGAIMGIILTWLEKIFNSNTNRLNMSIAFVFVTVALSMLKFDVRGYEVGFSSLLVCMMMGTIFCNTCPLSHDIMEKTDRWTSPLLAIFFVINGAELELSVFTKWTIVLVGVIYIVFRCLGKYFGTFISAKMTRCSPEICKYLGITLFPQAGVALGMCSIAMDLANGQGDLVRNITLFAVLIYELFGPVCTRAALTAAGDIKPMSDEVKNRRKHKLEAAKKA